MRGSLRRLAPVGLAGILLVLGLLLVAPAAHARPGGGHGFSGGHSHSSGHSFSHGSSGMHSWGSHSGSGGGGDPGCGCVLLLLIVVVVIVILVLRSRARSGALQHFDSTAAAAPAAAARAAAPDLEALIAGDPDFSPVLFSDFAFALYARAHEARTQPQALAALAPYLGDAARQHLAAREPRGAAVSGVVIGAMRVTEVAVTTAGSRVGLEFEANMTAGETRAQYVVERWSLVRAAGVRSKPPQPGPRSFHCPHCGAPFNGDGGGRCEYCNEVVTDGRFDWSVAAIELVQVEARPPALTADVDEVGTDWPTVFHAQVKERRAALLRDDPATTDAALRARLELIYAELNAGWTSLDLGRARPYVTDSLYDYLLYWITAYRQQGLRNVLEGMRVVEAVLAKVVRDKYFDSLTFRVWGAGRDSTVRQATGQLVSGNPRADRNYSEYWTLVRSAGRRGAPRADRACPNCGAPLAPNEINEAGECAHCGSKITSGEFDWVLSKIEQDESYTG